MDCGDEQRQREVALRAAEWFVKQRDGVPLCEAERASFGAWLLESPANVREYLAVSGIARELGTAASDEGLERLIAEALEEAHGNVVELPAAVTRSVAPAPSRPRPALRQSLAAAALVVLALGTVWFLQSRAPDAPETYVTVHGEQRTWPLPDGSVLHMNSNSKVSVRYSSAERRIEVEHGQALFNVVDDVHRPFRVFAGPTQVVAVGTQFDVYRRDHHTVVTVVEGKVALYSPDPAPIAERALPLAELEAGQQAKVAPDAGLPHPVRVNTREAVAWIHRMIIFERKPLLEVVEEFNRYARVPIEIEGEALGRLRVSGVFSAYDADSFVAFLRRLEDVEVLAETARIRVRAHPAPPSIALPPVD